MAQNQAPATYSLKEFNSLIVKREETHNYLHQVLGERKGKFINNMTALVTNNVALQKCQPITIMNACLKATALDLPFDGNLGFAYVIPYGNTAQFQMGYKGFIQLAERSGQFNRLNVTDVRKGELIDEDLLTGDITFRKADPDTRADLPIVGYVAFFRLNNGFEKSLYMTTEQIKAHAMRFSKSFSGKSSVWATDFDAMARKTVLKRLISQYAPLSIDTQLGEAVKADQAVIKGDMAEGESATLTYIDNPQVEEAESVEENTTEEPTPEQVAQVNDAKEVAKAMAKSLQAGKLNL